MHNTRDVTKGAREQGAQFLGRRITTGGKKSQQCHNQFFQNSTFASERPQFGTWGRQTCIPRRHLTSSLRPCTSRLFSQNDEICLQKYLPIGGKLSITSYLKQNAADYRSHTTLENKLKVEKKVYYFENRHNFHSPQKNACVRVETNIPKNLKAIILLALCPGRCLLHHKSIENDQTIFGSVKFAVSQ